MTPGPITALRRWWQLRQLRDPRWRCLFDTPPEHEWVALDCETTGLDVRRDEIISIGAVRIRGRRLLTSERLELLVRPQCAVSPGSIRVHQLRERDVADGLAPVDAATRLLEFIGPRPLVGYYLEFDVAMLNRLVRPLIGIRLPQRQVDVSGMYYDLKYRANPDAWIDLRFATLMQDLGLPMQDAHRAINDAVMAGLAFVKLRELVGDR
ncbi:MAG: 3'-5' exonuclease [Pseudomonadota bacterium]|nr:3'-5' exonuclease [Pseudomonadota bacterium]